MLSKTPIIPISQMRKPSHGEVNYVVQDHRASKLEPGASCWQSDSQTMPLTVWQSCLLTIMPNSFISSFIIHSFSTGLLSLSYVLGKAARTRATVTKKTDVISALMEFTVQQEGITSE